MMSWMIAMILFASSASMFDVLDEPYIQTVDELPYSAGIPSVEWTQNGNIAGYIDVIGFRNMTMRNGTQYIYGDPANLAIVAGDATGSPPNENGNGALISLDKSITTTISNNQLIVDMTVSMTWFLTCQDSFGKFNCGRKTQVAGFQGSEIIPQQININNANISIAVTKYNFTMINNTYAEIEFNRDLYDRYTYSTPNGTLEHISRVWHVEQTAKGIYFANETIIDVIKASNISHARDIIEVGNETQFNANASGFYLSAKNASITRNNIEGSTIEQFNPFVIGLFLSLYACFLFIKRRF